MPVWLEDRRQSVSAKTYVADEALLRLVPQSLAALSVNAVTDREVSRSLVTLTGDGLAESSVRRFRASLSSFFAWAVRERLILVNPVLRTRAPKVSGPRTEMYPFGEEDLERIHAVASDRDRRLADILLIAGWTGLRWSELRAIRVRDFVEVPMPTLVVQRAEPEGVATKTTKSGRSRRVPVADRVLRRSRRPTSTCTTWALRLTGLAWPVSISGGTPGAHARGWRRNDKARTPPDHARWRRSDGVPMGWS